QQQQQQLQHNNNNKEQRSRGITKFRQSLVGTDNGNPLQIGTLGKPKRHHRINCWRRCVDGKGVNGKVLAKPGNDCNDFEGLEHHLVEERNLSNCFLYCRQG
ncbi:unnamed protein product, partial [Polarella glacialis]